MFCFCVLQEVYCCTVPSIAAVQNTTGAADTCTAAAAAGKTKITAGECYAGCS